MLHFLFSCKLHNVSDNIVGSMGRRRSGKYIVETRRLNELHKPNVSNQKNTLAI